MSFSFVQITDHHLQETEEALLHGYPTVRHFQTVLRHLTRHVADRVDFIVSTGDLAQTGTEAEYRAISRMLSLRTVSDAPGPQLVSFEALHNFPIYFLPGNHDPRPEFFRHLFPHSASRTRMNAAFIHKGVQFICLDWGDQNKGEAGPEMFDFLDNSLQVELPAILLMHHPVVPVGIQRLDDYIADDIDRFWQIIEGQNILGILSGHVHMTYEAEKAGIPVFGLRATAFQFKFIDESLIITPDPAHYRLVTVDNGQLETEIFEVPL